MKIYKEISLADFEAWSGAKDTMETLNNLESLKPGTFDTLEEMLDDCGEGMDETEVNDFLWFENDTIADWLGFADWEELEKYVENDGEDEDEEEEEEEIEYTEGETEKEFDTFEEFCCQYEECEENHCPYYEHCKAVGMDDCKARFELLKNS